jgi:hypothetical protein
MSSEICHVWTRGVGGLLHQAKGCRCTSVQYPLYSGLLNWPSAYFHKFPPYTRSNMDFREISLPDFGIFRIRSAISVRSTGISRFDRHKTISSEICHVWTRGVGGLLHQAKGCRCTSVQYPLYLVLVNWTSAYFHKFLPSTRSNMDYRDISLPDFGIFRIRSAISVRSTGLSRFDGHTTMSSEICHVWTPGVGGLLHQAKGCRCTSVQYPLYFGLVTWTSAYFHKFLPSTRSNMDYRDISLPDFGIFRIRSAISVRSTGLSRFDWAYDNVKRDMSCLDPRCWRTATPGQGVPLYFGPVPLVLRPSYLNFGLLSQISAVYSF